MSTNWSEIIASLIDRKWSLNEIADAIGTPYSTLSDIKQGRTTEPRGMTAVKLHALYSTGATPPKQKAA